MSGLEVIGLVLGVWPVAMAVVKAAKDGVTAKVLHMDIRTQQMIYKESVMKLLQGDEQLSDKDRAGLVNGEESFVALWRDREFVERLGKRMEEERLSIFLFKSQEISNILKSLKRKVESYNEKEGQGGHKMRNLKLLWRKGEIKSDLADLKQHVADVRDLLQSYSTTTYCGLDEKRLPVQAEGHGHARSSSGEQRRRRTDARFFDMFHAVLRDSFHCDCPVPHEANLKLSEKLEIIFPLKTSRALSTQIQTLQIRSATFDSQATATPIDEEEEITSTSDLFRTTWSRSRKESNASVPPEYRALLLIFNESRGIRNHNVAPITDLCQWLKTARPSPPNSPPSPDRQGVLGQGAERYMVNTPPQDPLSTPTVISMDDALSSLNNFEMTRRIRQELALNLVMAIMQFYQTAWVTNFFTWRDFAMIKGDTTDLCVTRRFWSSADPNRNCTASTPSKFWRTKRNKDPMLIRLSFALIELAMGKRLSDIRAEMYKGEEPIESDDEAMKDMEDYLTAVDLLEKNVIRDNDEGTRPLKSTLDTFEDDLDRFIVSPLREDHNSTWGQAIAL